MAAMRWDEQSQAFVETNEVPKRYDPESEAWIETTGMSWDSEAQAWTERWGQKATAYVYGAARETVTIKKDGIIVATVETDSTGQSTEQITLYSGIYTLTGSVSGHTEEQAVNENTDRFRAMPEGVLYWYGNVCTWITGGWTSVTYTSTQTDSKGSITKQLNSIFLDNYYKSESSSGASLQGARTSNRVNFLNYSKVNISLHSKTTQFLSGWSGIYISDTTNYEDRTYGVNNSANHKQSENLNKVVTLSADINKSNTSGYMCFESYVLQSDMYAMWME